jgi:hypothetical protein
MQFLFLKGRTAKEIYDDTSLTLGEKVLLSRLSKTGLLDLRQNISALKVKTVHVRPLVTATENDLCSLENFSQKDSRDSGDRLRNM